MKNNPIIRVSMVGLSLLLAAGLRAEEKKLTLQDYTGWGYAPDLVHYTVTTLKGGADKFRLTDPAGKPIAIQVVPWVKSRNATLSFVAELPTNSTVTYTLRDDGQGAVPTTGLKTSAEADSLVLVNSLLGIRMPVPVDKKFDKPVLANTLPAPILGFRNGTGPWLGGGQVLCTRPVTAFRVTQIANGPVYAEIVYEMSFENGGFYHANIQVIDGVPLAMITEEYDAKELNGRDYWELDVGKGWSPDMVEAPREGRAVLSIADVIKKRPAPGAVGSAGQSLSTQLPDFSILPSYGWAAQAAFYVGLWSDAERKANSNNFTRVCVMPLHKGQWRMTTACEFRTDGKDMKVKLPMSARFANWHEEGASFTSPFSIGQHDPNLPRTYGRRVWGLMLAPHAPAWQAVGSTPGGYSVPWNNQPALFWRARNWYGVIGLDRYKNYVLQWPDKHVAYPRVFLTPKEQDPYRAVMTNAPLQSQIKARWGLTGDPAVAQREANDFKKWVGNLTAGFLDVITVGHHDMWGWQQAAADDVLAWPGLSAPDREEIRARLALAAYMWVDPDLMSAGVGDHTGNPNMSTSRQQSFANFAALLPDHPMYEAWKAYTSEFALYKIGEMMAPGGGWFEFGKDYHVHGFYAFPRGFMGHTAMGSPCVDKLFPYLKADMEYFMNLMTPVDSRYKARTIPGGANSALGYYDRWGEWIGAASKKDPTLAANLMWAFQNNGHNERDGGVTIETMNRPWIQAQEPKLTSQIYPGVGVVFRAHQGPDETYMYMRSGNNWSHWYVDQGHFLLHSKGATLVPSQPYQYYWPANKEFDLYNTIRFGHPENEYPYAWPDSNILDHHFGDTVDYAMASAGYPEWFITPSRAPGFGDPQKLIAGAAPQNGAFTWNRQVMFLKGDTARSPNYFVFRDTIAGAGRLPSWLNLNLIGRKTDVKQEGGHIALNTEWPVKLDLVFAEKEAPKLEMAEDNITVALGGHWGPAFWKLNEGVTNLSPNWMLKDGSPITLPLKLYENPGIVEKRVLLRLANDPGQEYFWMVYPRDEKEVLPPAVQLAPGVMKVTTSESTDYVFMSPTPIIYEGDDVTFSGYAGSVRVKKDAVSLALSAGPGRVGYKGQVVESPVPFERTVKLAGLKANQETLKPPHYAVEAYKPKFKGHTAVTNGITRVLGSEKTFEYLIDSATPVAFTEGNLTIEACHGALYIAPDRVRFVVSDRSYAKMVVGQDGVRGVGPFDLTFTRDTITGTVDGDTRTLVVTRPAGIARPMYHMDGMRYYAGYADDSSPDEGMSSPPFNLAFGVTEGKHAVKVAEWSYPSLPPTPVRRVAGE